MAPQNPNRACLCCGEGFVGRSNKKYCSSLCKDRFKYKAGYVTTESQYAKISGSWRRYVQRLLYTNDRKELRLNDLLALLEKQNYKCALTGQELTCTVGGGMTHMTNASIDRVIPGSPYLIENVRFVCRIVNVMKWNMSDDECKLWCRRILNGP